jgi:hypothetical protein
MEKEYQQELIRCAHNMTMTIRPDSQRHERIARFLMLEGYLIPKASQREPDFMPDSLSSVYGRTLTLTDKGKACILALSPEEFDNLGQLWPRAVDVRQAQERISADSG